MLCFFFMFAIDNALQKSLHLFEVNCFTLSDTFLSRILNLLNSSCKNLIVPLHVGFYISSPLVILRNCQPLLDNIVQSLKLQNLYAALTKASPSNANG